MSKEYWPVYYDNMFSIGAYLLRPTRLKAQASARKLNKDKKLVRQWGFFIAGTRPVEVVK